jgi:glycosyltransferase involved in cell wall biosynthesis
VPLALSKKTMKAITHMQQLTNGLKKWFWDRQKERQLQELAKASYSEANTGEREKNQLTQSLAFVCEEFFHPDLRGFGGFGKTVKNIAEHYNFKSIDLKVALAFPQGTALVTEPQTKSYHGTSVVLRQVEPKLSERAFKQYSAQLRAINPRLLITIDWYPSYAMPVYALSKVPLIIWIHDPRDREEWEKIAGVADELKFRGLENSDQLIALAKEKNVSIRKLLALQKLLPRRIVFATTAKTLVPRAERTYQIGAIQAHWLPNPIEIPPIADTPETQRPSLVYLGRLDAVKRPWIAFELAKRNPEIDFLIAGQAHAPELMAPWLDRYKGLANLRLLGHVDGQEKEKLIRSCWAILNTSVHEAEPVSFLEAFAYGKCVISCHDPEQEVTNFGYFTGEVLGEGLDEDSLSRFDEQIARLVANADERHAKGFKAREEMVRNHTFESFDRHLKAIVDIEGI